MVIAIVKNVRRPPVIDRTALKVNQAAIVLTVLLAFLLSALWPRLWWALPVLALVMLAGAIEPRAALFRQVYLAVLRPAGLLRPRPVEESPRPHNFAQILGGVFLLLASLAFLLAVPIVGWALAWIVLLLAFVNLAFGF
jgi:Domain of unknown function (DUF4395)